MKSKLAKLLKLWQSKLWLTRLVNPIIISILSTIVSLMLWTVISLLFFRDAEIFKIGVFATTLISFSVSYVIALKAIQYSNLLEEERLKIIIEQQRVKILSIFIQNAAHEFRTPLTVINNNVYLIYRISDRERQQEKLRNIVSSTCTINDLVDDMIHLTKLETADEKSYELYPAHIEALITPLKIKFSEKTQNKDISLTIDLPPDLPGYYSNEEDLLFVLEELLDNAARAIDERGRVHIKIQQSDSWLKIQVQDDGEGMEDAVLEHIFDSFYRKDENHTSSGMGLGLSISKRIIELHQGTIEVASDYGSGTCVTLMLPVADVQNSDEYPIK